MNDTAQKVMCIYENATLLPLERGLLAGLMDGKLLVVTNVPDLTPQQIIERHKSLADLERGFTVLKSELRIGPVYHRLPERIRGSTDQMSKS